VKLIHKIEEEVGKKMEPYNKKVITDSLEVTKVRFAVLYIKVLIKY